MEKTTDEAGNGESSAESSEVQEKETYLKRKLLQLGNTYKVMVLLIVDMINVSIFKIFYYLNRWF